MNRWSKKLIDEVVQQRQAGRSYGDLSNHFGISKSTLHYWLKRLERPHLMVARSKDWMTQLQKMGAEANKNKRIRRLENLNDKVKNEVSNLSYSILNKKAFLGILYWAEGAKGRNDVLNFANTDPELIKMFIALLRDCYALTESKFRIRLHLHDYHDESKVKNYWSNLTGIPLSQFTKSFRKRVKTNKTIRKNSQGVCFLKYNSLELKEEILAFGRAIALSMAAK